jgi:hypothetical protein
MNYLIKMETDGSVHYLEESTGALIGSCTERDPLVRFEAMAEAIEGAETLSQARTLLEAYAIVWQMTPGASVRWKPR